MQIGLKSSPQLVSLDEGCEIIKVYVARTFCTFNSWYTSRSTFASVKKSSTLFFLVSSKRAVVIFKNVQYHVPVISRGAKFTKRSVLAIFRLTSLGSRFLFYFIPYS